MSKATLLILSILVSTGPIFINKLISAQSVMTMGATAEQLSTMVNAPEPAPTNIVTTNRPSATGDPEFDIFYNGSIRGDLGEMTSGVQARTVTLLNRERRDHPQLISLCAGDSLGPSATSNVDGGKAVIDVMNLCKYDVSGIGPHEFSYGWDNFTKRAKQAQFPFVCSNLTITGPDEIVKPYVLIERNGSKLLVLGATSPQVPPRWPSWPSNVKVNDGIKALGQYAPLAKEADFVILLSSMLFEENIAVLKKLPWIHGIISTIVVGTKLIDLSFRDISLVDGRKLLWTFHSGKTTGFMNARKINEGVFMSIQLQEVEDALKPNPEAAKIIRRIEKQTIDEQSEDLCKLSQAEAANLPETMLNALRYELNGEIALVDLSSFKTKNDMCAMTPHGLRKIYPYLSRGALSIITGKELRQLWSIRHDPIIWNQGLVMIGLTERRGKLLINGRLLHNDRKYRVATTEFLALGSLGLLPKQPDAVQEASIIELLIRHFRKNKNASNRAILYKKLERRRIKRRKLNLDLAYERLDFGGSADQYQYIDPSTFGIGSDIPSLVGNPHDSLRIQLNDEIIMEDPRADTTLRLDVAYTTWNEGRSVDRAEFTIRKEATANDSRPRLFGEYKLTGTLRPPELADQSHPLFGKAVGGMVWKLSEHSKVLAGIGHLSRFSQPGKPMSFGLNMQYELNKPIHTNIDFKIAFDGFASWEEEEVRTADINLELRFKITRHLSTVARYRRFLWNDDMADDSAIRSEVFIGFGITKATRRF